VKRKGGGIAAKSKAVDALAQQLGASSSLIVTDYRGLKVIELQELRKRLRPKGVEYHVVKNSLLTRAASSMKRDALSALLSGPTAVAMSSGDEVDLAKGMTDEARTLKALRILGGFIGGQSYTADDIASLAKLPGRKILQGEIVGSIQAPLGQMTGILSAPFSNLIHVLTARSA
jgi:large subunit ribosomal protein L10